MCIRDRDYIKWVEFNVTSEAMKKAYQYDLKTYGKEPHLHWVDLLAILGARYGGDFKKYQEEDLAGIADQLLDGSQTLEEMTRDTVSYTHLDVYKRQAWSRKMLTNIAKAGYFSSDRTIAEYNKDIWHLK